MRILIVEDEKKLAESLQNILQKENFQVDLVFDGESGLNYAITGIYNVIILDVMLPKLDGFTVLSNMRKEKCFTPVIMLTAKSDFESKVLGLDTGADDYLTKPFHTPELLARIRALTRRSGEEIKSDVASFGDLSFDVSTATLIYKDEKIKLGKKECNIMEILIASGSSVVTKNILLDKVWGFDSEADSNNVEVYITFLRKKLVAIGCEVKIKTMRGTGYYLE